METNDSHGLGGLSAVASLSGGKGEDAVAEATSESGKTRGVIVADGIGSHALAKEAAGIAAATAQKQILQWNSESNLFSLFSKVHQQIRAEGSVLIQALEDNRAPESTCGTTLIVAIETEKDFQIGYTGNGAILHFRPVFMTQSRLRLFTWSAVNYLNPHSQEVRGQDALFRYLSLDDDPVRALPSVITIGKDPSFGDIVVICSDGIHSTTHVKIGADPDNNVFQTTGAPLIELYQSLRHWFSGIEGEDVRGLQHFLSTYLSTCSEKKLFDDDASLGILISHEALAFIKRRTPTAL